jgi:predicted acyltransferase
MSTVLDEPKVVAAEEVTSTAAPMPPPSERLMALDVFRGLTIASMLLVNNPGTWSAIYPPLEHADWHGWTPTDLIFPFFLFIVGITTHLSLQKRQPGEMVPKIIRRGLMIVLVGLLLNAFPFFWWGKIAGNADPSFWDRVVYRAEHLRFMGVLQRIGFAYMFAALLTLRTTKRQQIGIVTAILIGYWAIMTVIPVPGTGQLGAAMLDLPERTLAAWSDRLILGTNHIWASSKTWDPEGPLSTIPAIATAMLGVFAGRWLTDKRRSLIERIVGLYGAGCLAMLGGSLWGAIFPINKNLWTSSYVIFTAGFACVVLATCLWLVDVLHWRGWAKPAVIYGVNPLIAFVGSGVMARLIGSLLKVNIDGQPVAWQAASYQLLFKPYFEAKFGSFLWALCFVAFWLGVLWLLYRRKIFVRL